MSFATISFCPDLTDPNAKSIPLFHLSVPNGHLLLEFVQTHSELMSLIGSDVIMLGVVQMLPWRFNKVFEEAGVNFFFQNLTHILHHSNIHVSALVD